jgi:hypothetical protein
MAAAFRNEDAAVKTARRQGRLRVGDTPPRELRPSSCA